MWTQITSVECGKDLKGVSRSHNGAHKFILGWWMKKFILLLFEWVLVAWDKIASMHLDTDSKSSVS